MLFKVDSERGVDNEGRFGRASENYKRYAVGQSDALTLATEGFVAAIAVGDVASATARYPAVLANWKQIT